MTLLERVESILDSRAIPSALIGAAALAVHGVSRSTFDRDLLAANPGVLDSAFWRDGLPGVATDVRRGDASDPLTGVIRFQQPDERDVDLVVIRASWVEALLARAVARAEGATAGRVVTAPDLILLKLYAAGAQDRWDIAQLLAQDDTGAVGRAVDERVGALPSRCRTLWAEQRP